MADETLVFRDRSGAYYKLTRTVLDAARVVATRGALETLQEVLA